MSEQLNIKEMPREEQVWALLALVNSVEDYAIFLLDPDGFVVSWSRGAEKLKGYRAEEIIGRHFSTFYPPADADKPERELAEARATGRVEDEGYRLRKDGTRFWANVLITALRSPSGELRGFAKITRDMTARREAEQRLQRSEERLRLLIESVRDYAIFMLGPDGRIETWNRGAENITGYRAEEIVGQHFSIFYTAKDLKEQKPERELTEAAQLGRTEDESWRIRKDGRLFWCNVVITAMRDQHGTLVGYVKVTRDLTMRRNAEEELRRSEERFRLLIEAVSDYAIYMLSPQGIVSTWNGGAERLKGYTAKEIIGQHFSRFFPPEDVVAGKPQRELEVARREGRFEEESYRLRKDGTSFWANVVLTPVYDGSGSLIGYAKVTRDLTSRIQAETTARELAKEQAARAVAEHAEARVRDSEQRYRALSERLNVTLEAMADGVIVQNRAGQILFANTAAAHLTGKAGATSQHLESRFEFHDENGRRIMPDELPSRRVLQGHGAASMLLRVRDRHTDHESWSLVRANAVEGSPKAPEVVVSVWHDITETRRRAQHDSYLAQATGALATSLQVEAMLSALSSVLVPGLADWSSIHLREGHGLRNVSVAHTDESKIARASELSRMYPPSPSHARGVWTVVNTGQSELYADIPDELLAMRAESEEHLAALREVGMRSALIVPITARGRIAGALSLVRCSGRQRFDEVDLSLAEELGRRAGTALDNARLYAAERAARDRQEELARAAEQANRVKDEFLATVSHELRTPLNAILGWSTLLRARAEDPAVVRGLEVIERNARAQGRIVEDILDVSRIITGKLRLDVKPSDLVQVVKDSIEVVRPSAAAKNITINLEAPSHPCLLVADADRLQQVAWNLLSNAVKFTDSGGRIDVKVENARSKLRLTVRDSGRGIEPAFLPLVFERFKQADSSTTRSFGGLGLGLSIVRHLTELHGGQVSAHSEGLGHGASFVVTLPVRAVAPALQRPAAIASHDDPGAADEHANALAGLRVLIVDDEPDALELLTMVLGEAGAEVASASSASEALGLVPTFMPQVLISDIGLPSEDGYSLMQRVRALSPAEGGTVPSLALTAYTRFEDKAQALRMGFNSHLGKPVDPGALLAAVATLARLRRAGSLH